MASRPSTTRSASRPTARWTEEVEKRIADFGVNDVFEQAAERFSMHYGWSISENMVRRVVDRVGEVLESLPEAAVQKALVSPSTTTARLVTIGIDGSMLSTREGWQETKGGKRRRSASCCATNTTSSGRQHDGAR